MKFNLTLIAVSLVSGLAVAEEMKAPEYYSAEFKVEKVSPLCPSRGPIPTCMAMGSRVTVAANLGCADKLIFSEENVVDQGTQSEIHIVSVVKKHPKADLIRCLKPSIVTKTVVVRNFSRSIEVINSKIENN